MIAGYLSNIKQEIAFYPPALQAGFKFLMENDLSTFPTGQFAVRGDSFLAKVAEYETESWAERRPESHSRYLDIQYICAGEEAISTAPLTGAGEIDEDLSGERDVVYYKSAFPETELILLPGMFAVYFPWDIHRPNCRVGEQAGRVRKVTLKIAMDGMV